MDSIKLRPAEKSTRDIDFQYGMYDHVDVPDPTPTPGAYGDADSGADGHADTDADCHADGYLHPDGNGDGHPYGNADGHSDGHPDGHADGHPDGHADGHPRRSRRRLRPHRQSLRLEPYSIRS